MPRIITSRTRFCCRGKKQDQSADLEEGKKYLQKVIEMTPKDQLDRIDQQDSKMVLDDPSLACGYSRIQQEEVGAGAIKKP